MEMKQSWEPKIILANSFEIFSLPWESTPKNKSQVSSFLCLRSRIVLTISWMISFCHGTTFSNDLQRIFTLLELFKNVDECVHFWRIWHECNNISGESEQHSSKCSICPLASLDEAELGIEFGFDRSSGFVFKNWCSFFDEEEIEVEEQGDDEDGLKNPLSIKLWSCLWTELQRN